MSTAAKRLLATLLAAAWLAGCTIDLPGTRGPDPRLFELSPASSLREDVPNVDWQLVVEQPHASAAINTVRIALKSSPVEVGYYASAGWVDRAPVMIQNLIVDSFARSGRIVGVGREAVGIRADYLLRADLRDFQAELQPDGNHRVRVTLGARLLRLPDRAIVDAREIAHETTVPGADLARIVGAFDQALGHVLADLVAWVLITGEQAQAERRTPRDVSRLRPDPPAGGAPAAR